MSRGTLKFLAVFLGILIVCVLLAGLDNLPRGVRAQIDSRARRACSGAKPGPAAPRTEVDRDWQAEAGPVPRRSRQPAVARPFRARRPASWQSAGQRHGPSSTALEKPNRRQDRQQAESLLAQERGLRAAAAGGRVRRSEGRGALGRLKQHLPQALQGMERDYQAVHGFDLAPVAAAVQRAETDWPEKKADLEARLDALRGAAAESDSHVAIDRRGPAQGRRRRSTRAGFAVVSADADSLKSHAADLPAKADELKSLGRPALLLLGQGAGGHGGPRHRHQPRIRPEDPHGPHARAGCRRQERRHHFRRQVGGGSARPPTRPCRTTSAWPSSTSPPAATIPRPSAWPSRPDSPTWRRPRRGPTSTATGSIGTAAISGSSTASTR